MNMWGMTGIAARNEELFSSDAHGNTDAGYDGTTSTKRYTYDAYGNAISDNGEDDNPYRYCGENYDEETGLYYLRARYYDPSIGRFMSEDPAQDGLNWYVYCGNNPVMHIDPLGLAPEDHNEFGKDSKIAKRLDELGEAWNATSYVSEKAKIHKRAELLRGIARTYISRGNSDEKKLLNAYDVVIKYENRIREVASVFGINSHLIATTLFREVSMASADDWSLVESGLFVAGQNPSIGLAQIKVSTAIQAYDHWNASQDSSYTGHNLTPRDFEQKLKNKNENIKFLGMVLWDIIHSNNIWDERTIYKTYNGSDVYASGSMQYAPFFWNYFN